MRDPDCSKDAREKWKRFEAIRGRVYQSQIFGHPLRWQGFGYPKPCIYLAARFTESPMTMEEIQKKLDDLLQCTYSSPNTVDILIVF